MSLDNIKANIYIKSRDYNFLYEQITNLQNQIDNIIKDNNLDNILDLKGRQRVYNNMLNLFTPNNIKYITEEKLNQYCDKRLHETFSEDEYKLLKGKTNDDLINSENNGIEKAYFEIKDIIKKENDNNDK